MGIDRFLFRFFELGRESGIVIRRVVVVGVCVSVSRYRSGFGRLIVS